MVLPLPGIWVQPFSASPKLPFISATGEPKLGMCQAHAADTGNALSPYLYSQLQEGGPGGNFEDEGFHPEYTEAAKRNGCLAGGKLSGQLLLSCVFLRNCGDLFNSAADFPQLFPVIAAEGAGFGCVFIC